MNFFVSGGALKLLSPTENFANDQVLHCVKYVLSTQDSITGKKWLQSVKSVFIGKFLN